MIVRRPFLIVRLTALLDCRCVAVGIGGCVGPYARRCSGLGGKTLAVVNNRRWILFRSGSGRPVRYIRGLLSELAKVWSIVVPLPFVFRRVVAMPLCVIGRRSMIVFRRRRLVGARRRRSFALTCGLSVVVRPLPVCRMTCVKTRPLSVRLTESSQFR